MHSETFAQNGNDHAAISVAEIREEPSSMGSACSGGAQPVGSWAGSEVENPFELRFNKKDRQCLRETWQHLNDPKEIVGHIFVEIIEAAPELRKVFGVERAPKAAMLKMPKLGGHVARFTELIEQMTSFLGYTENLLGAWQLARKAGRMHTNQKFLEQYQTKEMNYFDMVSRTFIERLIPFLTGEQEEVLPAGAEKKKVRFANNYSQTMITDVWERFFTTLTQQLTESFELEMKKQSTAASQQALAPHQHLEEAVRKKKKIQERIDNESEMGNGSFAENKPPEELFEDPF